MTIQPLTTPFRMQDVVFVEHKRPWPGSDLTEHSLMSTSSVGSINTNDMDSGQVSRWIPHDGTPACPHCSESTNNYSLYAIFDGHNGVHAAKMCGDAVLALIESKLPLGCPPHPEQEVFTTWRESIQFALIESLVELNRTFAQRGIHAGCTATIVIVQGWLVTCANLGDSRAVLDTGTDVVSLSVDHRVATHKAERKRLEAMGAIVAPISMTGSGPADDYANGVGPLRIWPGGLCISRAIGDFDVGDSVLPFPHITQVLIPPTGGRLLVASDGVWDAFDKMSRAGAMSRSWSTEMVPTRMIQTIVRAFGGLKDDTSLIAVDILPNNTTFPQVVVDLKKSGGSSAASIPGGSANNGVSQSSGGFCGCFGGGAGQTMENGPPAPSTPKSSPSPDVSTSHSVRSMASMNSSVRGGNSKTRATILLNIDVAAVMGLMPDVELEIPGWYTPGIGEELFRSASEAAQLWHDAHAQRYGRPPPKAIMPNLERISRRSRKVAFAKDTLERKSTTGAGMLRSASHAYLGSTADGEDDYASKFGHYKAAEGGHGAPQFVGEPSVRAGRLYNSEASVRAGSAMARNAGRQDPSVHVRGSNLEASVHFKASRSRELEDSASADGLVPVRVVKRGSGNNKGSSSASGIGPQSAPVDMPGTRPGGMPNDSVKERLLTASSHSLTSIGE